ncbi:MAG: TlpA family protein disulfide reductase [Bryobacteraceae bacterium]
MKRTLDWLLAGSIAVLACALIWVVVPTLQQRVVEAGDRAPNFSVVTEHGKPITPERFGGKLLVVNFWATWCETCIVEMPSLDAFTREMAPQGVVVVGLSVDTNKKAYRDYLARTKPAFDTALDPDSDISTSFGTFQYPETYIIDSSGHVVEKLISNQNWMDPELIARVRRYL